MKKIILILTGITSAAVSFAQQGTMYLGGNVGFNSKEVKTNVNNTNSFNQSSTSWQVSPEFGVFLTDNLSLGAAITVAGNNSKNYSELYTGGTLYSRYFFGDGAFRPFIGANIHVLPGRIDDQRNAMPVLREELKVLNLGFNVNAGFAYALNDRFTAVGSFGAIGFQQKTTTNEQTNIKTTETDFGFSNVGTLGNRFTIGIYYTLN